jgi:hypothetical protein
MNKQLQQIWNIVSQPENESGVFDVLHDAIVDELPEKLVTDAKLMDIRIKSLFAELPFEIITDGIVNGFGDTCVRENIHEFIRSNKERILELL